MPRSAETASTNPTGIPMRLESGIWMPGETTANNINNNNNIVRNTSSPKVEIGDVGGGGRSIPVMEASAPPAAGSELPTPAETTGNPTIDALIERFNQQSEQINQLLQQQAQMLEVLQELVRQREPHPTTEPDPTTTEPDPTTTEPDPTTTEPDPTEPYTQEEYDAAHAENNRIWDEAHAENARIDQERAEAEKAERERRVEQTKEALERARDDFVRMTILRRARSISSLWHRNETEAYNRAYENYRNALRESMEAQADVMRAAGRSDEEIIAQLGPQEYAEQRTFAERVYSLDKDMYESGQKSFKDRMLRRWANYSTKKKLIIGLVAGAGVGFGASAVLGAGVAAAAVGLAARYSVGILNRVASARNVSEKSKNAEVARINGREQKERGQATQRRLLRFGPNNQTVDEYLDTDMHGRMFGEGRQGLFRTKEGYFNREMGRARGKNWFGLALLGASGALVGSEIAGAHLLDNIPTGPVGHWMHELGEKLGIGGDHHSTSESGLPVGNGSGSEYASWGIQPNTIHATNMTEFNKGVLDLLSKQGVHVHNFNQSILDHMNHYMENRPMASGMSGPHTQNLVSGQYAFHNPGSQFAEGFRIGSNGNGQAELLKWMDEATKQGASFSRS